MSKKLLEESTIRQFMKLAQLEPLAGDFLEEKRATKQRRPMHEEEMEEGNIRDAGMTAPPVKGLGKKETLKSTEKADAEARKKIEKTPGDVEKKNEEIALEEELDALFEEELNEMGDMVYEEEDEDEE